MAASRTIGLVTACLAALLSGCDDDGYEDRTVEFTTVLSSDVHHLVDNGYMTDTDMLLSPYESSPDYFYFVETPMMLDSVFSYVGYPQEYSGPPLDSLFPDGGSLLILFIYANVEDEVLDYDFSFYGDTVKVVVEIRNWDGIVMPGIREIVFPIGVVLQDSTR